MNFDHYTDPCVDFAVDLINAFATEPLEASGAGPAPRAELSEVLEAHGLDARDIASIDAASVQRLADQLHEIFVAPRSEQAVAVVNDILRAARALPQISGHDDQDWHLHYYAAEATAFERIATTAAMALAAVICTSGTRRLGRCDGTACRDVFVDTSRNNRRRFCSDGCANAVHVAAHRARRRGRSPT